MPLRLEIKKKLASRSDRVKSVDLHPTEPWVLSALYSGNLFLWNYQTQTLVKSFEVTDQPVRCARFIVRKQWIVCGADDMFIRVFNYNTMEKIREFEAHTDYIRYLEVHPTQPYVLSCSDDMQIKLWDWDKGWLNTQIFEGHAHYVMMCKVNPKDTNTFASASLDRSVKVWSLGSPIPNFSLEGHERGVNCIDYYTGGDKPYIISGADDQTIRIWDYQTKSVVQTLDGHTNNVSAVCFHAKLPIILSGSEDGTVRIWHSTTYRLETTLNYGLERVWGLAVSQDSNKVACGYDEGTIVIKLGHEMPVVSMDKNGKILMAVSNEVVASSVRGLAAGATDGEAMDLATKELGACEVYPQSLMHNSNGRFVVVCGDGEYIIYTSQALRNKSFGSALDFAWSGTGTGDYAVRESSSKIKIFKNFKETHSFKPSFSAETMIGGHFIAVRSSDFVVFYDWEECRTVRRIDVCPKAIYWSEAGDLVALACDECFYVLSLDRDAVAGAFANGAAHPEEGVEGAFDLQHEIGEKVRSGCWVGDCFLYTNSAGRLNYYVGGEVMTVCHLDRSMYILGFIPKDDRVYLMDKSKKVVSYSLLESILQYQTAVVRRDFELANEILPDIPKEQYNNISRFLESQGFKEEAMAVTDDPDQKFELALQLNKFEDALEIMNTVIAPAEGDTTETQQRWKQLGDLALSKGLLSLAEECALNASDLSGLLLMYTSTGNKEGIQKLGEIASDKGVTNIAFMCYFILGQVSDCVNVLKTADRLPEAAFLSRTYLPSTVSEMVELWRENLGKVSKRAAESLADPAEYPNLFPNLQVAVQAEEHEVKRRAANLAASSYLKHAARLNADLITEILENGTVAEQVETPTPTSTEPIDSPSPAAFTDHAPAAVAEVDAIPAAATPPPPVPSITEPVVEETPPLSPEFETEATLDDEAALEAELAAALEEDEFVDVAENADDLEDDEDLDLGEDWS